MDYSKEIEHLLSTARVKINDKILFEKGSQSFEGIVMPNTGDPNVLVIKLKSGYNIGLNIEGAKIKKLEREEKEARSKYHYEHDSGKKTILILHTGGTIASKIDYETGAVKPAISPDELVMSMPELIKIANVRVEVVFQMASDDMQSEHWQQLAKLISENLERYDGFIITQGTDTMHYTSAALSFMLRGIPKPVIIVGSQRSSDRGSSDATMNVLCAAHFIVNSTYAGVCVCMHATMNDDFCFVHSGTHVRKMHTSRRDAFKSVDVPPIAKVTRNGHVEMINYKHAEERFHPVFSFEKKVALIKVYPGFKADQLTYYIQNGYKGIVLEGTGLGHLPINETDEFTKDHPTLLETIRIMSKHMIVAMTSQCIFGKVNMNVYSPGRVLQEAGVIPVWMTPETAFVKLSWALGQKNGEEAKELFTENVVGEIVDRIDPRAFIE